MSTPYPSIQTVRDGSDTERLGGFVPQRATNGAMKVRCLATTEKTDFRLKHLVNAAQKTTLEDFYQANKFLNVSLVGPEDGVTYITRFVAAPQYQRLGGGSHWLASVRLSEV